MTTPAPTHSPNSPKPASPKLKLLPFAFPFLRKGQGQSATSAQFTDEHDIYRLLATSEPSGSYLVSRKGMWHGGIHVTEAGAGQALDLDAGLRCIADGVLVAWRANRDYLVSELAMDDGNAPFQAPYSTGFALVRHEMEFPRGTKLTFYSPYMHLMANADYDSNFPKRQKPAYWSRQWTITSYAQDKPSPLAGQAADRQVGLRVRNKPNGSVLGILAQGASVSIGKTETVHGATWGQLTDLNGATLYAPVAGGYVAPSAAIAGWIYLGAQNGGPVVKESIPDSTFDRVIVTTSQMCSPADPPGTGGIPVKAGDMMGHPGRYDPLDRRTTGTRMAHIEVFCDENVKKFIKDGRAWVNTNCANAAQWSQLGLSADPTILRVDRGTTLYRDHGQQGQDAKQTDVVQTYAFAALPQDAAHLFAETAPGSDGLKLRWWKVDSADMQRNVITGWVREQNFAGGRVTREFSQDWIDFECHDEGHDPAHTIFATADDYVDYALGSDTPGAGSLGKLSPLMAALYRVLYPTGDGAHAADELCGSGQNAPGAGFPWVAFRASRLIPKHESEWANPAKWQELVRAIEQRTGPKPEHEEEKKRIAKLAWWDEVQAGVAGFPGPEVYHINPVGLVGNFIDASVCIPLPKAQLLALTISSGFEGGHPMDYAATAGNFDGMGMSYGLIQWNAGSGTLAPVLSAMRSADPVSFKAAFPPASNYATLDSAITSGNSGDLYNWAVNQQSINPSGWKAPFQNLASIQAFKDIQLATAVSERHHHVMAMVEFLRSLSPDLMEKVELVSYCALFDVAVQQQSLTPAVQAIKSRVASEHPASQSALVRIAVEERAKAAKHVYVADCMSRRIGILQQSPYSYTAYGHTSQRTNANFNLISQDAHAYVCQI